jgi:hypothetical protein
MSVDDHGSCKNCGFDLNGERIYDQFLREYDGDVVKATEAASMYGCKEGWGRFGKEVYVKGYDEKGKSLPTWWMWSKVQRGMLLMPKFYYGLDLD